MNIHTYRYTYVSTEREREKEKCAKGECFEMYA